MIRIYGTTNCKWCKQAQAFCITKGLDYVYDDIENVVVPENWRTVPIIFVNDQFIGGFTELQEYFSCE